MTEARAYYGDNLTSEQRSRTMRAVKRRDTTPEVALRKALRSIGITNYRIDLSDVPGRPDIGFRRKQLAVFVDGGFWHGRPDRLRPGRSQYWDEKIQRNIARDERYNTLLRETGWKVVRLWDDEVLRDPSHAARRIQAQLNPRPMAEFFAGIGLVGRALNAAGFNVALANDIDETKRKLYAANANISNFIRDDVRRLHGKDIPDVDLATASFPCTDLSLAGQRSGLNGQHSGTFWEFIRIIEEMNGRAPKAVLIENVAGLVSSAGGRDLENVVTSLNKLGYYCDLLQFDARHWVAQSRVRTFVVGSKFPLEHPQNWIPSDIRSQAICEFAMRHPRLKLQAASLPSLPVPTSQLSDFVERLSGSDGRWWDDERLGRFTSSLSEIQRKRLERLAKGGELSWRTAYRRTRRGHAVWEIRSDETAGCLRTSKGGSSKQAVVEAGCGKCRVRWMTSLEYARLMGAPELDLSSVTENQALFGLGDAVCVPMVEWLGVNYLAPLVRGELTISKGRRVPAKV
jgi:DNA (cytosine-5)-methyltransferase 1